MKFNKTKFINRIILPVIIILELFAVEQSISKVIHAKSVTGTVISQHLNSGGGFVIFKTDDDKMLTLSIKKDLFLLKFNTDDIASKIVVDREYSMLIYGNDNIIASVE